MAEHRICTPLQKGLQEHADFCKVVAFSMLSKLLLQ